MNPLETAATPDARRSRWSHPLVFVLGLTALTYAGTLRFDFVSDDNLQIADNPFIKSWSNVPHFFLTSVWAHLLPQSPHSYYRPIYLLWNLVNYSLFRLNPEGWHAAAVLLHVGVTALVYLLVRRLVPARPALAWLTALVFGIHPIHHEVVAWISGATESLYAAFFLGAFLAYCRSRSGQRIAWMSLSGALYGLAMFSKETAIILPALVFVHAWLAGAPEGSAGHAEPASAAEPPRAISRFAQATGTALLYLPVAALYLVMRFRVLTAFGYIRVPLSAGVLLLTWPSVLLFYLRHWLLPFGYSAYYDFAYYRSLDPAGVNLPAIVLAGFVAALWLARNRLGSRETAYAAAWMLLPLLPALDLGIFPLHELAHDRYFYVPSIGAALLVALLLEPIGKSGALLWGQRRSLVTAALLLAAVLSFSAAMAANQWANDLSLLTRALQTAPQNFSVRNDLSAEWIREGKFDQAKALLGPLVKEAPQDWTAWLNLARVDYQLQDYAGTERDLGQVTALNPDSGVAYILLGQAQIKSGRMPDALASIRRAVELSPGEYRFHIIYGAVLQASGDCSSAVAQFNAALTLAPGEGMARRGLAMCQDSAKPSSLTQAAPSAP